VSQENVEAMRTVYAAMARGDFWTAREVFDPDIAWEWSSGVSGLTGGRVYRGIEGVETATRDWLATWEWFWQEAEEFLDAGDAVVVLTRMHGRPKGSEMEIGGTAADVWTFRDGKAVRFKSFDDRAQALEAAGLSE
jgi:ketosteroid isomerase-like protein